MQKVPGSFQTHVDLRDGWGVVKVILSFYRDDDKESAFERHRGRIPFDMAKHNSMDIASKHSIDFVEIKRQGEKFQLRAFD